MRLLVALWDGGAWGRWYIKILYADAALIVTNTVLSRTFANPLKARSRFHSRFANGKYENGSAQYKDEKLSTHRQNSREGKNQFD